MVYEFLYGITICNHSGYFTFFYFYISQIIVDKNDTV